MHGTAYANYAVANCDLLIAVGARFDDRVTGKLDGFAPHAKIVHIDIDPTSISKNVKVDLPVVGDARNILRELNKIAPRRRNKTWLKQILDWKEQHPLDMEERPKEIQAAACHPCSFGGLRRRDHHHDRCWSAPDVGGPILCCQKAAYIHLIRPVLGRWASGFQAALGAQVAKPDGQVVAILGDGGFQMAVYEMATAIQYGLPVKVFVLNNFFLGMVRQWQDLFWKKEYPEH